MLSGNTVKTTMLFPVEIKQEVETLARELKVSMTTFVLDSIKEHIQKIEAERWEKAAEMMASENESDDELKEWSGFAGDTYD
ncbi:MAG: hypothetical protein IE883_08145 [Epsilonproteobacteria bacterium]|nr:hypothetical protein [Campylobacterota bacterium]